MNFTTMISESQPHLDLFRVLDPLSRTSRAVAGACGFNVFIVAALVYGLPFVRVLFAPSVVPGLDLVPVSLAVLSCVAAYPPLVRVLPFLVAFSRLLPNPRPLGILFMFARSAFFTARRYTILASLLAAKSRHWQWFQAKGTAFPCAIRWLFDWRAAFSAAVFVCTASGGVSPRTVLCTLAFLAAGVETARGFTPLVELSVRKVSLASVTVFNSSGILRVIHPANAPNIRSVVRPVRVLAALVRAVLILPRNEVCDAHS